MALLEILPYLSILNKCRVNNGLTLGFHRVNTVPTASCAEHISLVLRGLLGQQLLRGRWLPFGLMAAIFYKYKPLLVFNFANYAFETIHYIVSLLTIIVCLFRQRVSLVQIGSS